MLDRDQIQTLTNRDAIVAFFAALGYNVSARLEQTPANLGISPEGAVRRMCSAMGPLSPSAGEAQAAWNKRRMEAR